MHAEIIALRLLAAVCPKESELFFCFYAFGDNAMLRVLDMVIMALTIVASSLYVLISRTKDWSSFKESIGNLFR